MTRRRVPEQRALLARLGFAPPPQRRRGRAAPSPAEIETLGLARAFHCGARYAANGWRRRCPPRMRTGRPGAADYPRFLAQQIAFYRGFDAFFRARAAHERAWSEPWPDAAGGHAHAA